MAQLSVDRWQKEMAKFQRVLDDPKVTDEKIERELKRIEDLGDSRLFDACSQMAGETEYPPGRTK